MLKIRTRFAPSPTGYLHIGGLRTVLFDYLFAKSQGGDLILRVEDTDQKREVKGAIEQLVKILDWIGIKFDEGPGFIRAATNGAHTNDIKDVCEFGPYIQSQRLEIYKKYADELLKNGKAYRCFCTPERLAEMRANQQAKKLPPRYDRACREFAEDEINKKIIIDESFVIRQKMPLNGEIIVHDELRGEIKFNVKDLDDHVLIKSNGIPTYQFANVVDDYEMKITHVLRGDEWLSSFPKNILLYKAFGWTPPKFIHLPLVLDKKGGKLSKRQGDVAVEDFKEKGYLPEALINFCALLGWSPYAKAPADKHPEKNVEIISMDEIIKIFDYKDISVSPAIFDIEKLDYLNGYYIRQKSIDELTELCMPYLIDAGLIKRITNYELRITNNNNKKVKLDYIKNIVRLEQERLKKLSEIGELTEFFFIDKLEFPDDLLSWKKLTVSEAKKNLKIVCGLLEKIPEKNWTNDSIEEYIMSYLKDKELKVGEYLWPMRVALTGRKASPGPFDVAEVLGKEESLKRIARAMKQET